jgi:response regulator RpfG family c-di-GMP phosphodiesterase
LKPAPLTTDEWAVMRMHPTHARDMLAPIGYLRRAIDIPYTHHERWDGSGYPRALRGEEIPIGSRIFAVADVWDSLRCDRPYRAAWPEDRVVEYVRRHAGVLFDPEVVAIFLQSEPWRVVTPA